MFEDTFTMEPKDLIGAQEAADFLGMKLSYLYKLVMLRKIPYYKPRKKLYFKRSELEAEIMKHRKSTDSELDFIAMNR